MIFEWLRRRAQAKQLLILALLKKRGALFGIDLVGLSNKKLNLGTVYVLLGRMEDEGLIDSHKVYKGTEPYRRIYQITQMGEQRLQELTS